MRQSEPVTPIYCGSNGRKYTTAKARRSAEKPIPPVSMTNVNNYILCSIEK